MVHHIPYDYTKYARIITHRHSNKNPYFAPGNIPLRPPRRPSSEFMWGKEKPTDAFPKSKNTVSSESGQETASD